MVVLEWRSSFFLVRVVLFRYRFFFDFLVGVFLVGVFLVFVFFVFVLSSVVCGLEMVDGKDDVVDCVEGGPVEGNVGRSGEGNPGTGFDDDVIVEVADGVTVSPVGG